MGLYKRWHLDPYGWEGLVSPDKSDFMVSNVKSALYSGVTLQSIRPMWIGFLWVTSAESCNSCRQAVLGVK